MQFNDGELQSGKIVFIENYIFKIVVNMNENKVFISYLSDDKIKVTKLVNKLKSKGIGVWHYDEDSKPGDKWAEVLKQRINTGSFFIACFSSNYPKRQNALPQKKNYMNLELDIAKGIMKTMGAHKWFIPVKLDDCEIPDERMTESISLSDLKYQDMFGDLYEEGLSKLVEVLNPESKEYKILDYNSEDDSIYTLWEWPFNRGLRESEKTQKLITTFDETKRKIPNFVDEDKLLDLEKKFVKAEWGGINVYLNYFKKFDEFGENDGAVRLNLSSCRYTEFLAYREMIFSNNTLFNKLKELVKSGPEEYINNHPLPTHVNTNVVLLNKDKTKFLATLRSNKVSTARETWVISMNETMRYGSTKYERDSDFFEAMNRGIKEELGLEKEDYSEIILGSLLIVPPRMGLHVIGVARALIDEEDVKMKKKKFALDDYEHDKAQWYPFNLESISYFLDKRDTKPNKDNDLYVYTNAGELNGKKWLHHVPSCLKQAWRMKDMI